MSLRTVQYTTRATVAPPSALSSQNRVVNAPLCHFTVLSSDITVPRLPPHNCVLVKHSGIAHPHWNIQFAMSQPSDTMAKCFIVSSVLGMALNICNPQEAEVESFGGNLGSIVQLFMNKGNHLEVSFVGCLFGKFGSLRLIPSMENWLWWYTVEAGVFEAQDYPSYIVR